MLLVLYPVCPPGFDRFFLLLLVPYKIFAPPYLPLYLFTNRDNPANGLCQKYSRRSKKSLWALLTIYYDSRTSFPTVLGSRNTHSYQ